MNIIVFFLFRRWFESWSVNPYDWISLAGTAATMIFFSILYIDCTKMCTIDVFIDYVTSWYLDWLFSLAGKKLVRRKSLIFNIFLSICRKGTKMLLSGKRYVFFVLHVVDNYNPCHLGREVFLKLLLNQEK